MQTEEKHCNFENRYTLAIVVMVAMVLMGIASGCSSLMNDVKNKQIGLDTQIYGLKATFVDPGTGTVSPTGAIGFGSINYRSIPVEAGQPYYARYTTKSIWSSDPASETVIWIGRASDKSTLVFEAVPDTMIRIGADGVKTGTAEVKLEGSK